jgi:hypothetical protein
MSSFESELASLQEKFAFLKAAINKDLENQELTLEEKDALDEWDKRSRKVLDTIAFGSQTGRLKSSSNNVSNTPRKE